MRGSTHVSLPASEKFCISDKSKINYSKLSHHVSVKYRNSNKSPSQNKTRKVGSQVSLVSSKQNSSQINFPSFSAVSAHNAFQQLQVSSGRPRSGLPYYILSKIRGKRIYKEKIDHQLAGKLRLAGTHTRRCRCD